MGNAEIPTQQSVEVARCTVLPEFLALEELAALTDYCNQREADFRQSQVVSRDYVVNEQFRRSRVLLDTGKFHDIISERVRSHFPWILRALRHPHFDISRIESQLTASNDGDFFRMHNDSTHAHAPSREITYVYFCHREPRQFKGGELLIYDSYLERNEVMPGPVRKRIIPEQNSIALFESSCLHEVLPVRCPSESFSDSRFTLNGWLHC